MNIKIMVVDDEQRIRKIVGDYLRNEGYEIIEAENGDKALELFYSNSDIDLILLDVIMPGKTGWEVCKEMREESDVNILFLTALGQSHEEAYGLNIGADDYITKPFEYEVLMARVKRALRRSNKRVDDLICKINELEINQSCRTVKVNKQIVNLSPREYELLVYFINNQEVALSRMTLLDSVWGRDFYGDPRTVDSHVKNIRAKIGTVGKFIKTVRGFGYKFEVKK